MLQRTLELLAPPAIVVAYNRSFLAPLVLRQSWIPVLVHDMLACPLCFGFQLSWIWLTVISMCHNTNIDVVEGYCYVIISAVACYVAEYTLQVLVSLAENQALKTQLLIKQIETTTSSTSSEGEEQ